MDHELPAIAMDAPNLGLTARRTPRHKGPSGGSGGVLERRPRLRFDTGQQGRVGGEEFCDRRCVLIGVAGDARRNEIARTVRPASWCAGRSARAAPPGRVPNDQLALALRAHPKAEKHIT
jgi:hypothetical protein